MGMDIATGATLLGIITALVKIGIDYGKMSEKIAQNEIKDKEAHDKYQAKFSELFARMNNNEGIVRELTVKVDNLTNTCKNIESKLDRLIERGSK